MLNVNNLKWKPVEFDKKEVTEGLVSIEECSDYTLNSNVIKITKKRKKKSSVCDEESKKQSRNDIFDFTPSKSGSTSFTDDENFESEVAIVDMEEWGKYGLQEPLLRALSDLNFKHPTSIQALSLPPAIFGRKDIVGAAETGSGKTLAFGLPILSGILSLKDDVENLKVNEKEQLYALILTPTRELAIQIKNHLQAAAVYTDIKITVVVGGMSAEKQERLLKRNPEIVIATPGRLWELIQLKNPHLNKSNQLRFLVIDETDRMLEGGHFEELHHILELLNEKRNDKKQRQNFVFSATMTLEHELPKYRKFNSYLKKEESKKVSNQYKIKKVIDSLGMINPKIVDVTTETKSVQTLTECKISCSLEEKDYYVYYFLQKYPGKTLIFCNSISGVKRLTNLLSLLQFPAVMSLHASMQQRQRLNSLDKFKKEKEGVLIATDVAARGLDIPSVDHVLHYQVPRTSESYVHRSGRTARASKDGIAIVLVEPAEFKNFLKLCVTLNRNYDLPIFPVEHNTLARIKQRVNLARDIEKLELEDRKINHEKGWLQKAALEMDIILDEKLIDVDEEEDESSKCATRSKILRAKRKQLATLLQKPIDVMETNAKYPRIANIIEMVMKGDNESAITVGRNAEKTTKTRKIRKSYNGQTNLKMK